MYVMYLMMMRKSVGRPATPARHRHRRLRADPLLLLLLLLLGDGHRRRRRRHLLLAGQEGIGRAHAHDRAVLQQVGLVGVV